MQLLSLRARRAPRKKRVGTLRLPPCLQHGSPGERGRHGGFSLIELMIVVAIIAILAAIAYPAYRNYIVKTHRVAAEACLSDYSNYMQRYYTTHLAYTSSSGAIDLTSLNLDCASTAQTGQYYSYDFLGTPSSSTFTLEAKPQGAQATSDTQCGTLQVDQAGKRTVTGSDSVQECWNQ